MSTPTPTPIEHPAQIGFGNKSVLDGMTVAYRCALRLAEMGFTITSIAIESGKPVIWVQPCKRCERLAGGWYRREPGPLGPRYTMQATVDGCRVQWSVYH